jgi:predicted DCC family thiol-disulfide oxidoreductase YuxK
LTDGSSFTPILYFDGVCNLCNSFVDALLRREQRRQGAVPGLRFASLQGQTAATRVPAEFRRDMKSLVYESAPGVFLTESGAALRVLGGFWKVFLLVPPFIRNAVYRQVAANRYALFGKRDTCRLPTPAERSRFLD